MRTKQNEPNMGEQINLRAQEIKHQTGLSANECLVIAADELSDWPDRDIATLLNRSTRSVKNVRYKLRDKSFSIDDQINQLQTTKSLLDDY